MGIIWLKPQTPITQKRNNIKKLKSSKTQQLSTHKSSLQPFWCEPRGNHPRELKSGWRGAIRRGRSHCIAGTRTIAGKKKVSNTSSRNNPIALCVFLSLGRNPHNHVDLGTGTQREVPIICGVFSRRYLSCLLYPSLLPHPQLKTWARVFDSFVDSGRVKPPENLVLECDVGFCAIG